MQDKIQLSECHTRFVYILGETPKNHTGSTRQFLYIVEISPGRRVDLPGGRPSSISFALALSALGVTFDYSVVLLNSSIPVCEIVISDLKEQRMC